MAQTPTPARPNYSTFKGNLFGVEKGGRAFEIATNLCDWFELGRPGGAGHWLEGQLVGRKEFLFNGRLFLPSGGAAFTVIDNFPKGTCPQGCTQRRHVDDEGFDLLSPDGVVLFGYRVAANICHVTVNLYAADGDIVAESIGDEFRIYRPPMRIGRGGVVWEG